MKVNDLVKVSGAYVEEYALVIEIGEANGTSFVKVRYFDGEEELLHPTQVRRVHEER